MLCDFAWCETETNTTYPVEQMDGTIIWVPACAECAKNNDLDKPRPGDCPSYCSCETCQR